MSPSMLRYQYVAFSINAVIYVLRTEVVSEIKYVVFSINAVIYVLRTEVVSEVKYVAFSINAVTYTCYGPKLCLK